MLRKENKVKYSKVKRKLECQTIVGSGGRKNYIITSDEDMSFKKLQKISKILFPNKHTRYNFYCGDYSIVDEIWWKHNRKKRKVVYASLFSKYVVYGDIEKIKEELKNRPKIIHWMRRLFWNEYEYEDVNKYIKEVCEREFPEIIEEEKKFIHHERVPHRWWHAIT